MQSSFKKKIYVIVGEESGENIAVDIISKLKRITNLELYGVGGAKLEELGLKSIFPFTELSIMGLIEILPKIPKLIFLINKTVMDITKVNPDLIITVDSPDFSFRVLKKIKEKKSNFKTLHIVAPTVWAWKSKRAKKISKYVDNLFVLFPFEKKYFLPHGIKTTFIGHPFLDKIKTEVNKTNNILGFNKKVIAIFPGSRKKEIIRHLNLILSYLSKNKYSKNFVFIVIGVDRYISIIENYTKKYLNILDIHVLKSSKYKNFSLKYSHYAIAVSGTISLELALCKIPLIVVYRLNFLSFFFIKKLVKVKYVSLANIILNKSIIPELIQNDFCFSNFNVEFNNLINNSKNRNKQIKMFEKLNNLLGCKSYNSESIAVSKILNIIL